MLPVALPVALAACGSVTSSPDAGTAAADADPAAPVTVTVGHVFGDSMAIEGLTVLFVGPGGAVVEATTDGGGVASARGVATGSTLLVFLRSLPAGAPEGRLTLAIAGIEPGDTIELADPTPTATALGSMTIDFPPRTGAATYRVENGCTAAFPTADITPIDFDDACVRGGSFDLLIRAADADGGLLGWIGGSDRFSAGDTFVLDATWSDPEDLAVDLVNVPAEPSNAGGRMNPVLGDIEYDGTIRQPLDLTGDDVQIRLAAPSDFVESRVVTIDLTPSSAGFGVQTVRHRIPAALDSLEVSLTDELLPWYGAAVFDAGERTLRWTRSSGREPDAQLVSATWTEAGEVVENGVFLLAPPDAAEVALPPLPAEYLEYAPVDPAEIAVDVVGAESSRFDGYRAARQRGLEIAGEREVVTGGVPAETHLSSSPAAEL
jgi:hypothetical protein